MPAYRRAPVQDYDDDTLIAEFVAIEGFTDAPEVDSIRLAELNAAPLKVADGIMVYADGTNWNPGAGRGFYRWDSTLLPAPGQWAFLG